MAAERPVLPDPEVLDRMAEDFAERREREFAGRTCGECALFVECPDASCAWGMCDRSRPVAGKCRACGAPRVEYACEVEWARADDPACDPDSFELRESVRRAEGGGR